MSDLIKHFLDAAQQVLQRRARVLTLAREAYEKLNEHAKETPLQQVRSDLKTLIRMAAAWASGRYARVPWKSMVYLAVGLLYFLSPLDLIPDMLAGIGFIDDAVVIRLVVGAIRDEVDAFRAWSKEERAEGPVMRKLAA